MADYLFFLGDPLFYFTFLFLAGISVIFFAAGLVVLGLSGYARKIGLSSGISGLLIVCFASSCTEFFSALIKHASSEAVFGALVGAAFTGLTANLGISFIVSRRMPLESSLIVKHGSLLFFCACVPFLLALDGSLSRPDGFFLVLCFLYYALMVWHTERAEGHMKISVPFKSLWRDGFVFLGALFAIFVASKWLVRAVDGFAAIFDLEAFLVYSVFVGLAATFPDMVITLKSVFSRSSEIGEGNVLGSVILDTVLFLGIIVLWNPMVLPAVIVWVSGVFVLSAAFFVLWRCMKGFGLAKHGVILLAMYLLFFVVQYSLGI